MPQGTARAAWDTRGAWDPASLWREPKKAKQGSSLFGCRAPALRASSVSGSSSTAEKQEILQRVWKMLPPSGRPPPPPCPRFPRWLGPWRATGASLPGLPVAPKAPGSPPADLAPARRARMPVVGQRPRTRSFPCLCWNMAAAEATPPAATGERRAARRASQAPGTACVSSGATLEVCGRPAGGPAPGPGPNALGAPDPPRRPPQAFRALLHTPRCRRPR